MVRDDGFPPARSALGLRRVLAAFGLLVSIAATVGFALVDVPVVAALTAVVGLTAVVDLIVIQRRIRRESHS